MNTKFMTDLLPVAANSLLANVELNSYFFAGAASANELENFYLPSRQGATDRNLLLFKEGTKLDSISRQ